MNRTASIIDNYINGNLTAAKAGAKGVSFDKLLVALINDYGKPESAAIAITFYLKGKGSFQAACDADYASR